jgi:hypothetical protein
MREKTFGYGQCVPGDRDAKIAVMDFAKRYNKRHRRGRQHKGPLTRAFLDVLRALLWTFHNQHTGLCFPSYDSIAEAADCARSTAELAVKALEAAGILSWCHRLVRKGKAVLRTSNGYHFHFPHIPALTENRSGTKTKEIQIVTVYEKTQYVVLDPKNALDAALIRFGGSAGFIK